MRGAQEVLDEVFDLFVMLEANDEQLDFPVIFASGRNGYAGRDADVRSGNLVPLFETIVAHVPPPAADVDGEFKMLVSLLDRDSFVGRILTGRILSGTLKLNAPIRALSPDGKIVEEGRASKIFAFRGLERVPVDEAKAGDIIALAGLTKATVADTIADTSVTEPLHAQPIDPPTLSMTFAVNDSPYAGRDGSKVTSRMIADRLIREAEGNVAVKVTESASKDAFEVAGRGELQLGVLIETMRREGFELSISRPRVIYGTDDDGKRTEPYETVVIDVDEQYSGTVVEKMAGRKAEMTDMRPSGGGKTRLTFSAPARGLIGYHGEFLSDTRGTGIMNRLFEKYGPYKGPISGRGNGVLISTETGEAVGYALGYLQPRGILMIEPGEAVYQGMVIGENARDEDLEVNPLKSKALTNFRASGKDDAIQLEPAQAADARTGDRLYRGRRARRSDAELHPAAQEPPRSARAQEGEPRQARLSGRESVLSVITPPRKSGGVFRWGRISCVFLWLLPCWRQARRRLRRRWSSTRTASSRRSARP